MAAPVRSHTTRSIFTNTDEKRAFKQTFTSIIDLKADNFPTEAETKERMFSLTDLSEIVLTTSNLAHNVSFAAFGHKKTLPQPMEELTSNLPLESQQKLLRGTLEKTWKLLSELYGNFSIDELGFLTLEEFIQLGINSLLTSSFINGRCNNVELLVINWKMKGEFKKLNEALKAIWQSQNIPAERQAILQKQLTALGILITLPGCYGEKIQPVAIPSTAVYAFICRKFYELCHLFSPIFSEANSNLRQSIHSLEQLSHLLRNCLSQARDRINAQLVEKEMMVYLKALEWMHELQYFTRVTPLRVTRTDQDPCDVLTVQDTNAIKQCKTQLEREFSQWDQWNALFMTALPTGRTEEIFYDYFQSRTQYEVPFFDHLGKFIGEQLEAFSKLPVDHLRRQKS